MLGPVTVRTPREELEIREVHAETALTACTYPGLVWSLNPYLGCAHACTFCYVPEVRHEDRDDWGGYVHVKRNLPTVLAREVRSKDPGRVSISTATDPYQFAESRCRVTRRCLEVLARAGWPVGVLTRSPLVTRDLDLLARFDDAQVGLSLPTLDDKARAALEPHAPSVEARLSTLADLAEAGLAPFVSFAPAYPPTGGFDAERIADRLADAGVRAVTAGRLQMREGVRQSMLPRVREAGVDGLARITDPGTMDPFLEDLVAALKERGIAWGTRRPDP